MINSYHNCFFLKIIQNKWRLKATKNVIIMKFFSDIWKYLEIFNYTFAKSNINKFKHCDEIRSIFIDFSNDGFFFYLFVYYFFLSVCAVFLVLYKL